MSARYEVTRSGKLRGAAIHEEPGHTVVAICCDSEWAEKIAELLNNGNGKPKPKRKATPALEGSPGARAWAKACQGARTYDALNQDKLKQKAMTICAREEGKPGPAPAGSVYRFYYSENPEYQATIVGAMAELAKLGVDNIDVQSREEYEAVRRNGQLQHYLHHLPTVASLNGARFPDAYQESICAARMFARELWPHDPAEAIGLTERIRKAECVVRERFPEYKRKQFQRALRNGAERSQIERLAAV